MLVKLYQKRTAITPIFLLCIGFQHLKELAPDFRYARQIAFNVQKLSADCLEKLLEEPDLFLHQYCGTCPRNDVQSSDHALDTG